MEREEQLRDSRSRVSSDAGAVEMGGLTSTSLSSSSTIANNPSNPDNSNNSNNPQGADVQIVSIESHTLDYTKDPNNPSNPNNSNTLTTPTPPLIPTTRRGSLLDIDIELGGASHVNNRIVHVQGTDMYSGKST